MGARGKNADILTIHFSRLPIQSSCTENLNCFKKLFKVHYQGVGVRERAMGFLFFDHSLMWLERDGIGASELSIPEPKNVAYRTKWHTQVNERESTSLDFHIGFILQIGNEFQNGCKSFSQCMDIQVSCTLLLLNSEQ